MRYGPGLIFDGQTATTRDLLSPSYATSTPLHRSQTTEMTTERHGGVCDYYPYCTACYFCYRRNIRTYKFPFPVRAKGHFRPLIADFPQSNMLRVWRRLGVPSSIIQHCRFRCPSRSLSDLGNKSSAPSLHTWPDSSPLATDPRELTPR